jgi:hypothetical protein
MLRDADGAPVLVYEQGDGSTAMVVTQESFAGEPIVVVKAPAVRDGSGNPVGDGSGGTVKSQSAAPMDEHALAVYQVDRYLLVPSASTGSGTASPIEVVPAPVPVEPDSE